MYRCAITTLVLLYLPFLARIQEESDCTFDENLLQAMQNIVVEQRPPEVPPIDDIFSRPILRSRAPKRGEQVAPWENMDRVSEFPNGKHVPSSNLR